MSLELAQVRKILATIPEGMPFIVEGNGNIELYYGNRDCEYSFTDDDKEVFINIKPNTENNGVRYKRPFDVQILPYSEVQRITINLDYPNLVKYLKNEGISDDIIQTVSDKLAPLLRCNMNPFDNTNRALSVDEYQNLIKNN